MHHQPVLTTNLSFTKFILFTNTWFMQTNLDFFRIAGECISSYTMKNNNNNKLSHYLIIIVYLQIIWRKKSNNTTYIGKYM